MVVSEISRWDFLHFFCVKFTEVLNYISSYIHSGNVGNPFFSFQIFCLCLPFYKANYMYGIQSDITSLFFHVYLWMNISQLNKKINKWKKTGYVGMLTDVVILHVLLRFEGCSFSDASRRHYLEASILILWLLVFSCSLCCDFLWALGIRVVL